MTKRKIDRFLATLSAEMRAPARAYLTGAAAGALLGGARPSNDIDLGIENDDWEGTQLAVNRTTRLTGIPANVAQDIDRWGMITLLDYRRSSRRYRRFGQLEVRLLHPANWSIGKLTRYLDPDLRDVVEVFRRQKVSAISAARLWGRALRASPPSTVQFQFRRNVEDFMAQHGRSVWGTRFDSGPALRAFYRAARIT